MKDESAKGCPQATKEDGREKKAGFFFFFFFLGGFSGGVRGGNILLNINPRQFIRFYIKILKGIPALKTREP